MTIIDLGEGETWNCVATVECSICGARLGEDYEKFALHVEAEHGPVDVGLSPLIDENENENEQPTADPARLSLRRNV